MTVIRALHVYPKWKDQNDKLVAYPAILEAGQKAAVTLAGPGTEAQQAAVKVLAVLQTAFSQYNFKEQQP